MIVMKDKQAARDLEVFDTRAVLSFMEEASIDPHAVIMRFVEAKQGSPIECFRALAKSRRIV